jgi:hypothetical protein
MADQLQFWAITNDSIAHQSHAGLIINGWYPSVTLAGIHQTHLNAGRNIMLPKIALTFFVKAAAALAMADQRQIRAITNDSIAHQSRASLTMNCWYPSITFKCRKEPHAMKDRLTNFSPSC